MRRDAMAVAVLAVLAMTGPSCGGKAVVDPGAGVGGTGGTGTSSSSGTGGTGTSSSSGTGGTSIAQACGAICAILDQCGQEDPGCVVDCQQDFVAECETEYLTFLQCLAGFMSPPTCEMPLQCEGAIEDYLFCEGAPPPPPCDAGPCYSGSDGSCGCEAVCADGVYGTDCVPSGGATVTCSCSIDGNPIGSCSHPLSMEACDVFNGCCGPIFFGWE